MEERRVDFVSIGGGPAGLTAALYTSRARLSTLVLDRGAVGGQMFLTERVDNYPGFVNGIKGPALSKLMERHAVRFGAEITYGTAQRIGGRCPDGLVRVETDAGVICAKTAMLACGAHPRNMGIPGETEFYGRGVSYCAICDGPFFRGQTVVVVGGGDSAVEEAFYLSKICGKVYIVHRRDQFRAKKIAQEAVARTSNVEILWDTVPTEVLGDNTGVRAMELKNVKTGAARTIDCTGVFFYVGFVPNTDWIDSSVISLNPDGFVVTDANLETNVRGVFAAGDVRRMLNRQITTAVADGTEVALNVDRYLQEYE